MAEDANFILSPATWENPVTVNFTETDCLGNPYMLIPLSDGSSILITHITENAPARELLYDAGHLCANKDLAKYKQSLGCIARLDGAEKSKNEFVQELTRYIESLNLKTT